MKKRNLTAAAAAIVTALTAMTAPMTAKAADELSPAEKYEAEVQIIKKIGGSPEVKKHLEDLGFNVGGQVSVISSLGENLIVKVKESRVAVSDELARKIMV